MITTIATSILVFSITSVIAFLFRKRQLYAAVLSLYKHSTISDNGAVCELIVSNNGVPVEEGINVEFDPRAGIEIIASSSDNIQCIKNTITIDRLHGGESVRLSLLVEHFSSQEKGAVTITSKSTRGRIFKSNEDFPPNYAKVFLISIGFILAVIIALKLRDISIFAKGIVAETELSQLYNQGWRNLGEYNYSDLRKTYSRSEFPVSVNSDSVMGPFRFIDYTTYNKLSIPLKLSVYLRLDSTHPVQYVDMFDAPPMSKVDRRIFLNPTQHDVSEMYFSFQYGDSYLSEIRRLQPKSGIQAVDTSILIKKRNDDAKKR